MSTEAPAARQPQFMVTIDGTRCTVTFNGTEIANVKRVSVSNDIDADDVNRSSITIDLVGEPVLTAIPTS